MKQIYLSLIFLFAASMGLTSCKEDCEPTVLACNETPPTDELCGAAFNRWFYKRVNNKCEQIAYSGCSQNGFSTQQECEQCKCN